QPRLWSVSEAFLEVEFFDIEAIPSQHLDQWGRAVLFCALAVDFSTGTILLRKILVQGLIDSPRGRALWNDAVPGKCECA
ncbi:hypothetical protein JVV71_18945, partial [Vibrio cholerae O1]|nr:hypothetical protein [Vibrio cholerae O1]